MTDAIYERLMPLGKRKGGAFVKVLSCGCSRCQTFERNALDALGALGLKRMVTLVTDPDDIAKLGAPETPALVIGGRLVSYGEVLSVEQIISAIVGAESI